MVRRHGVPRRNEIATVKVAETAIAIVHHHEHLLSVTTRAQDKEVVVMSVVALIAKSLSAGSELATSSNELCVTSLVYVNSILDVEEVELTVKKIRIALQMTKRVRIILAN